MNSLVPTIGLYRHFKGTYYFVQNVVKDCTNDVPYCYYFDVCKPEKGFFIRPVSEWFSTETDKGVISERPDNTTGQIHRFERVKDLNFQLGSISTQHLTDELIKRTDSPIHELDIEELRSKIDCRDYVIGQNVLGENYVIPQNSFDNKVQAKQYLATHKVNSETHLYKRILIREK